MSPIKRGSRFAPGPTRCPAACSTIAHVPPSCPSVSCSFSASARYRSGYFHARHDLVASKNDTGILGCTRKFNWEWMCQVCLKMGTGRCPDDVRQDCHGGGGGPGKRRRRRGL